MEVIKIRNKRPTDEQIFPNRNFDGWACELKGYEKEKKMLCFKRNQI